MRAIFTWVACNTTPFNIDRFTQQWNYSKHADRQSRWRILATVTCYISYLLCGIKHTYIHTFMQDLLVIAWLWLCFVLSVSHNSFTYNLSQSKHVFIYVIPNSRLFIIPHARCPSSCLMWLLSRQFLRNSTTNSKFASFFWIIKIYGIFNN